MSYKAEVIADSTGNWNSNALRFATQDEAQSYGRDLMGRWMAVREMRVVESTDPVNYDWTDATGARPVNGGVVCQ